VTFDRALPPELAALNAIEFDYDDGDGIDYEPFDQFMSAEENANWFPAWTGNPEVTASEFRVFGQDGTGGYAALWLVNPDASLLEQPVVFLGSEGETGVVARDFADYLWLVAGGYGPMEAVEYAPTDDGSRRDEPEARALAEKLAGTARKSPAAVLTRAQDEFPGFSSWIESMCR
jgi:hypothetical protein